MQIPLPAAASRRAGRPLPVRRSTPDRNPLEPSRVRTLDAWDRLLIWLSAGVAVDPQALDRGHLTKGGG